MATILHNSETGEYLKSYDGLTGEVVFTNEVYEAKTYQNDWFAEAERDYLRFHFAKDYPKVNDLMVDWYEDGDEDDWDDEEEMINE